jgi:ATP-dependent DNA helicase HFM1/MER3
LAVGVNLPARLVIIKGTQIYVQNAGYKEYSELDILQMVGRAGRPQFDDVGISVIMTTADKQHKVMNAFN